MCFGKKVKIKPISGLRPEESGGFHFSLGIVLLGSHSVRMTKKALSNGRAAWPRTEPREHSCRRPIRGIQQPEKVKDWRQGPRSSEEVAGLLHCEPEGL